MIDERAGAAEAAASIHRCLSKNVSVKQVDGCMIKQLRICYSKFDPHVEEYEIGHDEKCAGNLLTSAEGVATRRAASLVKSHTKSSGYFLQWQSAMETRCKYEASNPDKNGAMPFYDLEFTFCRAIEFVKFTKIRS